MMLKRVASLVVLLVVSASTYAQQRPMSPPERAPVPLTDADQQRARAEELAKQKPASESAAPQKATQIKIPLALLGRHISSGNPALDSLVGEAAAQNGLDPCLIFSVMRAESSFNRMAVSVKG